MMFDSYPMLAITGMLARLSAGSPRYLWPEPYARSTSDVKATTKGSWLLTDVKKTMGVVEKVVNLAFEGRPPGAHPRLRTRCITASRSPTTATSASRWRRSCPDPARFLRLPMPG